MSRSTVWARRVKDWLIAQLGGCCAVCTATEDLEFTHVVKTKCHGGRGSTRHIQDVLRHPNCYILVCMDCHDRLDGRARRKR
jgi:5-methylcytosine-specific restriction endonuclease McrA